MKRFFVLTLLPLFLLSCEGDIISPENYEYEESVKEVLELADQEVFDIQSINGNIQIMGSDTASQFYLEITRRVKSYRSPISAADHINDIKIDYKWDNEAIFVEVDHPSNNELDYEVDFVIIGPILFDYNASLGNGDLDLDIICRNLNTTVGNGNIVADVILLNDCQLSMETGNGNIDLIIPNITNAALQAIVGNGRITHTGLDIQDLIVTPSSLFGTLGNGEGIITLSLGNGNIALTGY